MATIVPLLIAVLAVAEDAGSVAVGNNEGGGDGLGLYSSPIQFSGFIKAF